MTRMEKRATINIDGETVKAVPVFKVDNRVRELSVSIRRLRSIDEPEEAPDIIHVTWSGKNYDAEYITFEDGNLVYHFRLDTPETRY